MDTCASTLSQLLNFFFFLLENSWNRLNTLWNIFFKMSLYIQCEIFCVGKLKKIFFYTCNTWRESARRFVFFSLWSLPPLVLSHLTLWSAPLVNNSLISQWLPCIIYTAKGDNVRLLFLPHLQTDPQNWQSLTPSSSSSSSSHNTIGGFCSYSPQNLICTPDDSCGIN